MVTCTRLRYWKRDHGNPGCWRLGLPSDCNRWLCKHTETAANRAGALQAFQHMKCGAVDINWRWYLECEASCRDKKLPVKRARRPWGWAPQCLAGGKGEGTLASRPRPPVSLEDQREQMEEVTPCQLFIDDSRIKVARGHRVTSHVAGKSVQLLTNATYLFLINLSHFWKGGRKTER